MVEKPLEGKLQSELDSYIILIFLDLAYSTSFESDKEEKFIRPKNAVI